MPLMPERVKYRKMHRGNRAGLAYSGNTVAFGEYGLMSLERCWLDTKQIEAARVAIARNMKRHGKMWIRIFPQKSFTKKPLETRMGKGKGPAGIVGGGHPPGERAVRGGRGDGNCGARVVAPGGDEAAHPDQVYFAASGFALDGIEFMKFTEMKDMTLVELSAKSRDLRHEMFNLRLQQASAQLEKPARLRTLRRDIARLETRISQLRNKAA